MTTQGPDEPPRIRVARSVTLAIGPNYEKAEFEVEATAGEGVGEAIQRAQAILEEYVRNFRLEHEQPPKSESPSNALGVGVGVGVGVGEMPWKPWTSGGGESLREDLDPKLASFLLENRHDGGNPYRCEDGYDYWLYPFNPEPGRARFIQRVKRR